MNDKSENGKIHILFAIICFFVFLVGNFLLFRQEFIWALAIGTSRVIYVVFGGESITLLAVFLRSASRRMKYAVAGALVACIIGFIFELALFINRIGIFGMQIGLA